MSDSHNERHQNNTTKRHRHISPIADGLLHQQPLPFLPDELISQILLLLPVRSLLLFKCVCKLWKTLISDSQFANNHLQNLTVNPSIIHQRLFSSCFKDNVKILSIPVKPSPKSPSEPVEFIMEHGFVIFGSCNGLLCMFYFDQGYVKLWNPSIRYESKNSPTIDSYSERKLLIYHGFGYDQINDKYKVLVALLNDHQIVTKIYTFGGNSWTTIKNFPYYPPPGFQGKFVSGTLNWVIVKRSTILSLDLEKETYKEVLLPKHDGVDASDPVLGVSNNCLCVYFDSNKTHWDIWLMKKYGVVESWTRLMIIPREQLPNSSVIVPLFVVGNSNVLFDMSTKFVMYNLNNGSLDYHPCYIAYKQHIYIASLVSPQF